MKRILVILTACIGLYSCKKEEEPQGKVCEYNGYTRIDSTISTLIPLHSSNFWIYEDSLWIDGNLDTEKSSLMIIEQVYDLNGMKAVQFTPIFPLPMLAAKDDTLFAIKFTPEQTEPNCYELTYPMFFATEDTTYIDSVPYNQMLIYRSTIPVVTSSGTFSDNIVYQLEDFYEIVINEQVGIIKASIAVTDGGGNHNLRVLTLKDYDLN